MKADELKATIDVLRDAGLIDRVGVIGDGEIKLFPPEPKREPVDLSGQSESKALERFERRVAAESGEASRGDNRHLGGWSEPTEPGAPKTIPEPVRAAMRQERDAVIGRRRAG